MSAKLNSSLFDSFESQDLGLRNCLRPNLIIGEQLDRVTGVVLSQTIPLSCIDIFSVRRSQQKVSGFLFLELKSRLQRLAQGLYISRLPFMAFAVLNGVGNGSLAFFVGCLKDDGRNGGKSQ